MTYRLRPHISATTTPSGMVLLDERSGRYWQLNGTAAMAATLLIEGGTTDSVTAVLRDRFPSAAARIGVDVQRLVETLREAGLLS